MRGGNHNKRTQNDHAQTSPLIQQIQNIKVWEKELKICRKYAEKARRGR